MSAQAFRTVDKARLEVQADDTATTNLVRNPVPELGTYLWETYDNTAKFEARYDQPVLPTFRLTAVNNISSDIGYPGIKVTAGKYLGVSAAFTSRLATTETASVYVSVYDAAGNVLTSYSPVATWSGTGGRTNGTPVQMPAGAATALVIVRVNTTNATAAGRYIEFTQVAARLGATSAAVAAVPYTEPYEWLNVLGKTHAITAIHDGIGLGTLAATIYDATLDPAISPALRAGRMVRLTAQNPVLTTRWESVWQGVILTGRADYDLSRTKVDQRARIQISAANGVTQAANTKRPQGVATIPELAYLLEGASVPWAVNGSGTQPPGNATYLNRNDAASLLDQVAITRDSRRGYAWVDRRGVLNVVDTAGRTATLAATLTEADYTDLAIDYDTDRCINEITVKALRVNLATGQTGEVAFGPYRDQASIDTWGAHNIEITVQGLTDAEIAAYAAAVLAANATPVRKVNSLRFPIRTAAQLTVAAGSRRAMLDTYDPVRVTNTAGALDQTLRATTITHTLTAGVATDKWLVDLEFATDAGAATPIKVPAPPGPSVASAAAGSNGAWQGFVGAANVVAYGNPFATPSYRVVNGEIVFRGLLKYTGPTKADNTAFTLGTLPLGARPGFSHMLTTDRDNAAIRLDVQADGQLIVYALLSTSSYISLDGVRAPL